MILKKGTPQKPPGINSFDTWNRITARMQTPLNPSISALYWCTSFFGSLLLSIYERTRLSFRINFFFFDLFMTTSIFQNNKIIQNE